MALTIEKIEESIRKKIIISGYDAASGNVAFLSDEDIATLENVTICILIMKNGFVVTGESAPIDSADYCFEVGRQVAYQRALDKLYPLIGYELKTKLNEVENEKE